MNQMNRVDDYLNLQQKLEVGVSLLFLVGRSVVQKTININAIKTVTSWYNQLSWLTQDVQALISQFSSRLLVRYPFSKTSEFLVPDNVPTSDFLFPGQVPVDSLSVTFYQLLLGCSVVRGIWENIQKRQHYSMWHHTGCPMEVRHVSK